MKTIGSLLIGLAMISPLMAVEYVTLNKNNTSVTTNPGDIVEVLTARFSGLNINDPSPRLTIGGVQIPLSGSASPSAHISIEGKVFSGISEVTLDPTTNTLAQSIVVLRVTKPNEGFKSEPLVVPVAQGTSYSVALETSTDMQTWTPCAPGDYASTGPARFFRVKAAVTPGAP